MKKETFDQLHKIIQKEIPDANAMIVVSNDKNGIASSLSGNPSEIGQAIYATIFDPKQTELSIDLFRMITDIVYNIVRTPSEMADTIIKMVQQAAQENLKAQSDTNIIPLIPHGEA